ncbi:MAG TPA: MGMT family protein [Candidatus Stackebrandtia faecavium]|nr:MGMT family protein [Candidatus Stackebrandtia faecavium]
MDAVIPDYADDVLSVVESIPPGAVMTYGDVARHVGRGGPRQVGRVMALYGAAVCWWRVVRADGDFLPGKAAVVLECYRKEGTPLRGGDAARVRIDMTRARWAPEPRSEQE